MNMNWSWNRWDSGRVFNLLHWQSAGIVPHLSSNGSIKKRGGKPEDPFSFCLLNINTTVDSIMRDHDMEKARQCRTDSSAASCSPAEKRPLNNNILINAPLPLLQLKQTKSLLGAGRRRNWAGRPLLALDEPPFTESGTSGPADPLNRKLPPEWI